MKVTEFFLGFGPRIWSFRRGEVEYGLKVVPLGAYVRIIGMNNLEEVDPADEPRTYRAKGYWSRFCVAVAGVAMNFALALVLLFVALVGFGIPKEGAWQVGTLSANSPAAAAGLQPGDRILAVDGQTADTFGGLTDVIRSMPGQAVVLTILRNGETVEQTVTLADRHPVTGEAVGFLGIGPSYPGQTVGPLEGVQQTFSEFGRITYQSITGLGQIFSPDGLENYSRLLSGDPEANQTQRLLSPVGAVKIGTEVAENDLGGLLLLLAAINIFVGLLNLVPLLPFDGGHIAIATYEAIRSRPGRPYRADVRKLLPVSYALLAVVMLLFIGNVYLDFRL
jgi:RIP metalloprotease RseP